MPKLMQLHEEFHDRGLEVITIHDDSVASYAELDEILKRLTAESWNGKSLRFPVLLDGGGQTAIAGSEQKTNGATTALYGITSFPTTLVVGRDGRIHDRLNIHDEQAMRQMLEELLK
jgi:hypothetical protein